MPVARAEGWRIISGHVSASTLTSSYAVADFPIQADQSLAAPWTIDSAGTTAPKFKRIVQQGDESWAGDGFAEWTWRMSYMTFGMVDYWTTLLLPGEALSADVTVMTYNRINAAVFYQAKIKCPEFPGSDAQIAPGGWGNVIWRFHTGVQIFP